jgi:tryptophan halogenase
MKKIIIVGGGSAGWMTAAALIKTFPEKEITLIESPSVPIIGVGESTLAGIKRFCRYLEIDEKDFIKHTDASVKLSIKFTDFYEKNHGHFHYPFGSPYFNNITNSTRDWFIKKAIYPETNVNDFVNSYFPSAALFNNNKFCLNEDNKLGNFNPATDTAYHFDATKFGNWLKVRYCIPRGVKVIQDDVTDVVVSKSGVEYLKLKNSENVYSDLFIDCTGFNSMLLGEALKEPFEKFDHILPNNRAWATQLPYINKELELEPFTNCTAIDNGWVWNIPLWSRIGTGYVYSDKFVSPEAAKEEFKNYLKSSKMLFPRDNSIVDNLKFKDIKFKIGIHKRTFVKNVVSIGLSAGFIEPLESNGLFTTHEFLFKLLKTLQKDKISNWDRDCYNKGTYTLFKSFVEFVSLHYSLSVRSDTEYWRSHLNRDYMELLSDHDSNNNNFYSLYHSKIFNSCIDETAGIKYVATGMNFFIVDAIDQQVYQQYDNIDHKIKFKNVFDELENRKIRWNNIADSAPTLYKFLKETYYKDE